MLSQQGLTMTLHSQYPSHLPGAAAMDRRCTTMEAQLRTHQSACYHCQSAGIHALRLVCAHNDHNDHIAPCTSKRGHQVIQQPPVPLDRQGSYPCRITSQRLDSRSAAASKVSTQCCCCEQHPSAPSARLHKEEAPGLHWDVNPAHCHTQHPRRPLRKLQKAFRSRDYPQLLDCTAKG